MDQIGAADGAGRAQRVAERDSATLGVDAFRVQLQFPDDRQALCRERLIELYPVQLLLGNASCRQCLGDRFAWPYAHDLRWNPGNAVAGETGQWCQRQALHHRLAHQYQRRRAITHLRAVAGGDAAIGRKYRP